MEETKKAQMGIIAVLAVMLVSMNRRLPEARKLSSGITTLALAGIVLLVAAGGASAASTPISDCQEITAEGEYHLANSIDNSTAEVCIYIKADNVILDGRGHYINGISSTCTVGNTDFPGGKSTDFARPGIAVKSQTNVTIKNVEVKNFCTGILLYGTSSLNEEHTVENCTVHDNGDPNVDVNTANFHGIALHKDVCNSTINNNTVYNSTGKLANDCEDNGAGINFRTRCKHNDITNNKAYNNAIAGIYSKAGGYLCYNLVFNNTVYGNGQTGANAGFTGGIRLQCKSTDWNTIANNTVTDNFGPGIFIGGRNCTVENNTVTGSKDANTGDNCRGDGLRIDRHADGGGRDTNVYDNTFCDNEHLDINVQNAAAGTIGDHNYCDTGANYQDSSAGVGDICEFPCPAKPDLVIIDKYETWIVTGVNYTVTYTVENQGGAASVVSTTDLYIDNGCVASDSTVPVLDPSQTYTYMFAGPFTLTGSCDDISLLADKDDVNDECDENNWKNNTFCSAPLVTVSPPTACVDGTFFVDIEVNPNGLPVYGVEYNLTCNRSVMRIIAQREGTFLSHNGNDTFIGRDEVSPCGDYAYYGLTRTNSLLGETTPGILVTVEFETVGSPLDCGAINLTEVVVGDNNANPLGSTLENVTYCICGACQPPVASGESDHMYNNWGGMSRVTLNGSESTDTSYWTWAPNPPFGSGEIDIATTPVPMTSGCTYNTRTVVLTASSSCPPLDTDTFTINVYIEGDANGDCVVNILDASMTGLRWNKVCDDYTGVCWGMTLPTPPPQVTGADMADRADLNNDCNVNILDASIVGLNWGDRCSTCP